MRPSKLFGVAGIVGVAATGAVLVRHERHRRAYTAEEVRARLQGRVVEVATAPADPDLAPDWPADVEPPQRHPLEAAAAAGEGGRAHAPRGRRNV